MEARRSARLASLVRLAEKMMRVLPASPSSRFWGEEDEESAGTVPLPSLPLRSPLGLLLGVGSWAL